MASIIKQHSKKIHTAAQENQKQKNNRDTLSKASNKKDMFMHLLHPDYILFDWEFFSRELEFE
jgi:hypothetical protein